MPAIAEAVPTQSSDRHENINTSSLLNDVETLLYAGQPSTAQYRAIGLRFSSIGPSTGDTIDDANLLYGVHSENMEGADTIAVWADTASGAIWGASDRPSQITKSIPEAAIPGSQGAGNDKTVDVTSLVNARVQDGSFDGDIRFDWEQGVGGNWDRIAIRGYGATFGTGTPFPAELEGNYTAGGGGGGPVFVPRTIFY